MPWPKGRPQPPEACAKNAAAQRRRTGEKSGNWKGGRKRSRGYVMILVGREHPMAQARGYVLEHRLVMASAIGRTLRPEEVVHHINEIKDDNRLENLMLFANQAEHQAHHKSLIKVTL